MRKRNEDKECYPTWKDIGRQPNIQSWVGTGGMGWGEGAGVGGEGGGVQQCSRP